MRKIDSLPQNLINRIYEALVTKNGQLAQLGAPHYALFAQKLHLKIAPLDYNICFCGLVLVLKRRNGRSVLRFAPPMGRILARESEVNGL